MHTVKKDGYMEQYTQTIGKNVYTVRGKFGYLVVRGKDSLSVFLFKYWTFQKMSSKIYYVRGRKL